MDFGGGKEGRYLYSMGLAKDYNPYNSSDPCNEWTRTILWEEHGK
jgi:hypothetical protein